MEIVGKESNEKDRFKLLSDWDKMLSRGRGSIRIHKRKRFQSESAGNTETSLYKTHLQRPTSTNRVKMVRGKDWGG